MKITKSILKQIIKEELESAIQEGLARGRRTAHWTVDAVKKDHNLDMSPEWQKKINAHKDNDKMVDETENFAAAFYKALEDAGVVVIKRRAAAPSLQQTMQQFPPGSWSGRPTGRDPTVQDD